MFLFLTFTCKPTEWVARLKTQTRKTETLENENSDPKKSDSLCVSKTQAISQPFFAAHLLRIASRHLICCSSIQCHGHNLRREEKNKTAHGGRFLCSDHENNTQHSYVFFGCFISIYKIDEIYFILKSHLNSKVSHNGSRCIAWQFRILYTTDPYVSINSAKLRTVFRVCVFETLRHLWISKKLSQTS